MTAHGVWNLCVCGRIALKKLGEGGFVGIIVAREVTNPLDDNGYSARRPRSVKS
jgi:hypothetical protein